jgi:DNA-binding beta-propeller fold protein YncE
VIDPDGADDLLEGYELTGESHADGLDDESASRQLPIEFYSDEPGDVAAEPGPVAAAPARSWNRAILFVAVLLVVWLLWPRARAASPVQVLRPPFEVVLVIEGPGSGDRPKFDRPLGAAFGEDGDIYVSDSRNGRVCVFDAKGGFVRQVGREGATGTPKAAVLLMPVGLDVDASGTVYVADLRVHAVRVYDERGVHLRDIAPPPAAAGEGWQPTDVAVSALGVLVSDATGVERFRADGRRLGRLGTTVPAGLDHPNGVAVASDGTVLVSDTNHGRVVAFTPAGGVRWVSEGAKLGGSRLGLPRGLAAAPDGGAWVADAFGFDVARISEEGTLTARYGQRGSSPGMFEFPNDVDVRGDLLLVTDKENNRVQVLRVLR